MKSKKNVTTLRINKRKKPKCFMNFKKRRSNELIYIDEKLKKKKFDDEEDFTENKIFSST